MITIKIWEPRYRDMSVLVARFRIPPASNILIKILRGARKGLYIAKSEAICSSPIEFMRTKSGKKLEMRVIPLSKLEIVEEDYENI